LLSEAAVDLSDLIASLDLPFDFNVGGISLDGALGSSLLN